MWSQKESKQENNLKKIKWFAIKMKLTIFTLVMVASTFLLSGCQRLTDVEEKSYILSLYIDYSSNEKGIYEFWVARADLNEM